MAVELLMHISRAEDSRLSGTVRVADGTEARPFSGTLELMRVFEELVPVGGPAPTASEGTGTRAEGSPRS